MRSDLLRRQQVLEWIYLKIQTEMTAAHLGENPKGFGFYL
jgi:hypothetical protein